MSLRDLQTTVSSLMPMAISSVDSALNYLIVNRFLECLLAPTGDEVEFPAKGLLAIQLGMPATKVGIQQLAMGFQLIASFVPSLYDEPHNEIPYLVRCMHGYA